MTRCASGGIILSSVDTKYQLGFVLHAGSLTAPLSASTPHGTWESAMNAAPAAPPRPRETRQNGAGLRRDVRRKRLTELRPVEEEIPVLRRHDRRDRRT